MSTWWERTCRWRRASRCCHAFHGKGLRKCFRTSISSTSLSGVSAGAAAAGACAAVWCSKAAAMTGARSVISSGGGWCQPCPNLRAICIRQSWTQLGLTAFNCKTLDGWEMVKIIVACQALSEVDESDSESENSASSSISAWWATCGNMDADGLDMVAGTWTPYDMNEQLSSSLTGWIGLCLSMSSCLARVDWPGTPPWPKWCRHPDASAQDAAIVPNIRRNIWWTRCGNCFPAAIVSLEDQDQVKLKTSKVKYWSPVKCQRRGFDTFGGPLTENPGRRRGRKLHAATMPAGIPAKVWQQTRLNTGGVVPKRFGVWLCASNNGDMRRNAGTLWVFNHDRFWLSFPFTCVQGGVQHIQMPICPTSFWAHELQRRTESQTQITFLHRRSTLVCVTK